MDDILRRTILISEEGDQKELRQFFKLITNVEDIKNQRTNAINMKPLTMQNLIFQSIELRHKNRYVQRQYNTRKELRAALAAESPLFHRKYAQTN